MTGNARLDIPSFADPTKVISPPPASSSSPAPSRGDSAPARTEESASALERVPDDLDRRNPPIDDDNDDDDDDHDDWLLLLLFVDDRRTARNGTVGSRAADRARPRSDSSLRPREREEKIIPLLVSPTRGRNSAATRALRVVEREREKGRWGGGGGDIGNTRGTRRSGKSGEKINETSEIARFVRDEKIGKVEKLLKKTAPLTLTARIWLPKCLTKKGSRPYIARAGTRLSPP